MEGSHFIIVFLLLNFLHLLLPVFPLPLCTNSEAPLPHKDPLKFCPYNGTSCCNSADDLRIQKQFQVMNISNSACAALVKSVLCAECDKFSAELFRISSVPRQVPVLCNSTASSVSTQTIQDTNDFCSNVWKTCQNASITNSPFAASLKGQVPAPVKSNVTKLMDLWQSEADFCNVFGGASGDGSVCFDGEPVALNSTAPPSPPGGLCLERIGNNAYLNMAAHPDGSTRAFFSNQEGKIWLATIPEVGSGGSLELDEASPFVDLSDEVHFDTQFGLMGIAFHPKFSQNGRFFASFNCDKQKWPGCAGRCACNSDVNCDPSKLPPDSGAQPCQYQTVIAEFTANGTASKPSEAKSANAHEVRRIFTMGLPFTSHHGGQILFGPDGYLYFMMGDGGGAGSSDPYNFAQNKKSLLGKIMRLDIDNIPSATEVAKLGLWGNYSIPKDNPYTDDKELQPEIWALGFQNPWRCSFDSARPSYFMCADVGQDHYEEVDLVTKGGNYGWRVYEGPFRFTPPMSPGGNTSVDSITPILPVMGYNHSDVNKNIGSASITGGYFYRSTTDPCMYGRYLYADLYGGAIWAGSETPEDSGVFSPTLISFACSHDSPMNCSLVPGSSVPALGYIFSFGEDNNKDIYILASSGVYRVVPPSKCNISCSKENTSAVPSTQGSSGPVSSPPSEAPLSAGLYNNLVVLLLSLCLLLVF
nr:HIPL1 protein-like [Ipomoea batatas]